MNKRALADHRAQVGEHALEHLAARARYLDLFPPATPRWEHVRSLDNAGGLIAGSQQLGGRHSVRRVLESCATGKDPSPIVPIEPPGFVINNFVRAVTEPIDSVDPAADENPLPAP